jgi:3-hydroxybutyrate dehydrogenase
MDRKVALVTGSTSGIGLGVAHGLAQIGCDLVITGFGDDALIKSIKDEFQEKYQARCEYVPADLTRSSEVERMVRDVKELFPDGVDILVNNAGFQHVSPIESFPQEKWDALIGVLLTAPFVFIKTLLPDMRRKKWGRIVNIASVHGVRASPNKAAYVSAKHGIVGLTKVVALETAASGVTCNAICPGYVDTPILQGQVQTLADKEGITYEEAKGKFLASFHPSRDAVGIKELAEFVNFVCSENANQLTGASIVVDGGWTAK